MNSTINDRHTGRTIDPGDIASRDNSIQLPHHFITYNPLTEGQPAVTITIKEDPRTDTEVTILIDRQIPVIHSITGEKGIIQQCIRLDLEAALAWVSAFDPAVGGTHKFTVDLPDRWELYLPGQTHPIEED